jgi:glycine hydroxymethyltransferase
LHPSPVPFAEFVTSTTHKTLRGPRGGIILCKDAFAQAIDKSVFPGIQGGPLMHTIAAKAVAFGEALQPSFKTYQQNVIDNARAMAEEFVRGGLRLVAGGTDTHLMLVDVSVKGLTGKAVEAYLDRIGITVNKNAIPYDQQKPMVASGIRIGTPAISARGLGVNECREVARIMVDGLGDIESQTKVEQLHGRVRELTSRFDVP